MGRLCHLLGIIFCLGSHIVAYAKLPSLSCDPPPTPAPFRQFLVFSAQGIYKPAEGPFPEGCSPDDMLISIGVCTDSESFFFKSIMNFTDEEIDAEVVAAKDFFLGRFGLDVDELAQKGRIVLVPFQLDPRQEYTVFFFSGEAVPSRGYEIRDGGHILAATDPEGVELGGASAGQILPEGGLLLFGFYNIRVTGPKAREEVIRYSSITPAVAAEDGSGSLNCELQHSVWGEGLAQGFVSRRTFAGGQIQTIIRNVLTFPPLGQP